MPSPKKRDCYKSSTKVKVTGKCPEGWSPKKPKAFKARKNRESEKILCAKKGSNLLRRFKTKKCPRGWKKKSSPGKLKFKKSLVQVKYISKRKSSPKKSSPKKQQSRRQPRSMRPQTMRKI